MFKIDASPINSAINAVERALDAHQVFNDERSRLLE